MDRIYEDFLDICEKMDRKK